MNSNQLYGSIHLRLSRKEANKHGVDVPHLTTWRTKIGAKFHYQVFAGRDVVWEGVAFSSYEAKAHAIDRMIEAAVVAAGGDPNEEMYEEAV